MVSFAPTPPAWLQRDALVQRAERAVQFSRLMHHVSMHNRRIALLLLIQGEEVQARCVLEIARGRGRCSGCRAPCRALVS